MNQHDLHKAFLAQKDGFSTLPYPSRDQRAQLLKTLELLLLEHSKKFEEAISEDFGFRSSFETKLSEVFVSVQGLRYARQRLAKWLRPVERSTSYWALPSKSEVRYQPKGVVGIISPWNYPLYLTISPLTYAWAAGNRAMLKLSEDTPVFSSLLAELLKQTFDPQWVTTVTGGPEVGARFSSLPFDHLLFTGSTEVGKKVMAAASANLTPVTLELGGKCPVIVTTTADLLQAARKVMAAKLLNAGQTCIAPDYVLVRQERKEEFLDHLRAAAEEMLPEIKIRQNYTSLINQPQYDKIKGLHQDALDQGAEEFRLVRGPVFNPEQRVVAPVALVEPADHSLVMQQEIFGPLLPVQGFKDLPEAISRVNQKPRPLVVYLFAKKNGEAKLVTETTHSGAVSVNTCLTHLAQDDLPFGGVGESGMGRYHGHEGFAGFSNPKALFYQSPIDPTKLLSPPYGLKAQRVLRLLLRR